MLRGKRRNMRGMRVGEEAKPQFPFAASSLRSLKAAQFDFVNKMSNIDSGLGISKKMRTFCKKMSIADLVYAFDATSC